MMETKSQTYHRILMMKPVLATRLSSQLTNLENPEVEVMSPSLNKQHFEFMNNLRHAENDNIL